MSAEQKNSTSNRAYEAFGRGYVQSVLEACTAETEWAEYRPASSGMRSDYRGHVQAVRIRKNSRAN